MMETLNYHHLYYFWMVCREGGFTKAGLKLRLSQSAISEQVKALEAQMGQKLIDRTTRTLGLTEAGNVALKYADTIFSTGKELVDVMKHRLPQKRQLLRIGALGSLSRNLQVSFLRPLLERTDINFSVTVGDSKRLLRLLKEHSLDIVLSTFPAPEEVASELYTHLLIESPLCMVASSRFKKSKAKDVASLLKDHRLFLPSSTLESRSDFDHFVESHALELNISGEVDDVALLRVLALTGKGVAVVPLLGVQNDIENRSLMLLHEFKNIQQRFYAITRQKRFPNPVINELLRGLR